MSMAVAPVAASAQLSQPTVDFLARPRYSQATYIGRVQSFFSVIDPRTLLTKQSEIDRSVALLNEYKAGKRAEVTQEQIWAARKIKESCVHPDTGHTIFPLCRFSAFVPTNIPLVRHTNIRSELMCRWCSLSYHAYWGEPASCPI
jgi:hypothetical protein